MRTIKINGMPVELTEDLKEALESGGDSRKCRYPMYFRYVDVVYNDNAIVKFFGPNEGVHITTSHIGEKGKYSNEFVDHNTSMWEYIPHNEDRGLYHKQPIYAWNKGDTHGCVHGFYDAINDKVFGRDGTLPFSADYISDKPPMFMQRFMEKKRKLD